MKKVDQGETLGPKTQLSNKLPDFSYGFINPKHAADVPGNLEY